MTKFQVHLEGDKSLASRYIEGYSSKLRQPTGQSQDNFNFGPSPLKGVFSKCSGNYIVVPNFYLLS